MHAEYRKFLTEGERAGGNYALRIPPEAMAGTQGCQLGRQSGSSLDFKDYREYQPGDDLRKIDWNVYGRTDKLTVKLYREEVNPHLDLILDCSKSMDLPNTEKARATLGLSGLLATAANNARCSHAVWANSRGYHKLENSSDTPSAWEGISFESSVNPAESFAMLPPRLRKNSIRILISDLLWVEDPLLTLRPLANGAAAVIVVQVLAREDDAPSNRGNMRIVDVENNQTLEIFVDAVAQKRYREALANHRANWLDACRQTGAKLATVIAEDIVDDWRIDPLEESEILGVS